LESEDLYMMIDISDIILLAGINRKWEDEELPWG
jgi:hypothetical protein